jgi:D-alanyl-lipoteichoic acid acyltransferase DltB (MBOAT superfamily)
MGLLMLSTLLDYIYGFSVASPNRKKAKFFLWLGIINNLGILGVFKYYNFFTLQFQQGLEFLGLHTNPVLLNIALPVGISFYTFHGMSYVFDIYRGQQKPVRNFIDYAVFVSFFPLLVAGPIERASHLLPQVQKPRAFKYTQAMEGCRLMLWGMFKKIVIADNCAEYVNLIFENYSNYNALTLLLGAVLFSFQIYGDFSGYTDIARGTAKLFGFELLLNFNYPYFSRDIAEFWRRWHISLSSWFKDYLYIPLGGSKNGKLVSIRNTFIIFLVSGFWHGASWNFIAWGFIHACGFLPLLILNKNRNNLNDSIANGRWLPSTKEFTQIIGTFFFVTFAWIFFRAETITEAINLTINILTLKSGQSLNLFGIKLYQLVITMFSIVYLIITDFYLVKNAKYFFLFEPITLFIILYMGHFKSTESFIYFQF